MRRGRETVRQLAIGLDAERMRPGGLDGLGRDRYPPWPCGVCTRAAALCAAEERSLHGEPRPDSARVGDGGDGGIAGCLGRGVEMGKARDGTKRPGNEALTGEDQGVRVWCETKEVWMEKQEMRRPQVMW
ncbi:hypothetical protein ACJZ2D_007622 [Fusarium nematophilum]